MLPLLLFCPLFLCVSSETAFLSIRTPSPFRIENRQYPPVDISVFNYSNPVGVLNYTNEFEIPVPISVGALNYTDGFITGTITVPIDESFAELFVSIKIGTLIEWPFLLNLTEFHDGKTVYIKSKRSGMRAKLEHAEKKVAARNRACQCVARNCACCEHFRLPHFHHDVCVNISYNPVTIGLDLSIGVDNHYVTREISARNPPPVCFAIPGLHDVISACISFKQLNVTRQSVTGCVEFEAELIHMRVFHEKLGCFRIPI